VGRVGVGGQAPDRCLECVLAMCPLPAAVCLSTHVPAAPHHPATGSCPSCRYELLCEMEPLLVGGSTTGEIHFGRHTDVQPPLRYVQGMWWCEEPWPAAKAALPAMEQLLSRAQGPCSSV